METSLIIMYNMIKDYIYPLLDFAEIYVTEDGFLKPKNNPDPEVTYNYEGRPLVIISSNAQYLLIKTQNDKYEIFNPIINARQIVFLANMVMQSANKKSDITSGNLVYDEDLDEYIESEDAVDGKQEIRMFHMKDSEFGITNRISFSYTDKSGNPVEKELAGYAHDNIVLATIGACINLAKKFKHHLSPNMINTDVAILKLMDGINKFKREQQKERKEEKDSVVIKGMTDEEMYESDASEFDDVYLDFTPFEFDSGTEENTAWMNAWDKRTQYQPSNPGAKIWKGLVMPTFKTVDTGIEDTGENKMIKSMAMIQDITEFDDIDLIN